MALYIDRRELPEDLSYIPPAVLQYVIDEHRQQLGRLEMLHNAYLGRNMPKMTEADDIAVVCNYPRYIVDVVTGMFLGDPVKYNTADNGPGLTGGVRATIRGGELLRADKLTPAQNDISSVVDAYKRQSITDIDKEIGRDIGEYGEAYELEYASDDENPIPKTVVCDPRSSIMVRDTSVEHHKLFFMTYEKRKHVDTSLYYAVFVYTDKECIEYYSDGITAPISFIEVGRSFHFFGEVPAVEYSNNADRLGDYETVLPVINAYNKLMSDRVTDKSRFIDAVLFLYGMSLTDEQKKDLKKYGIVDTLPPKDQGAAAEFIQKTLEEGSVHVLADDLVKEIHKQSMTVDMTDASFGTASGQAMKLKLLTMTMLVKNKVRSMERGLKKRFQMYNRWLAIRGVMAEVDREEVDIVFSIQLPIDETGIVNVVKTLQGIVDDETLLGLLWFIKDPAETIEKVRAEQAEKDKRYLDTFGITAAGKENIGNDDTDVDSGEDRKRRDDKDKQDNPDNQDKS